MKKYTIALVQEYPIWEPAEGGYYYSGQEVDTIRVKTRKEAREIVLQTALDFGLEMITPDYASNNAKNIGDSISVGIYKKNSHPRPRGRVTYQ